MTDAFEPDDPDGNAVTWPLVPTHFRTLGTPLPEPWEARFGPLRRGTVDDLVVVGQIGQSIDGRIATVTGHSKYINGPAGLAHLHRLRALVDAVLVGIGTAVADNPLLTVRRCAGPNPARIVLDPRGRLSPDAKVLTEDGVRRLVITAEGIEPKLPAGVEIVAVAAPGGEIAPSAILAALRQRGLARVLIEGGAHTVSRFIAAGCLDRLHVMVAPIMLGAGQSGVTLKPIATADLALRAPMRAHLIGDEVLLDCDLTAQRIAVGRAKKST
jgi:riboflavin-specific deaminase-like protein